eukprot:6558612-Pyramimonas_sp.AAC.1
MATFRAAYWAEPLTRIWKRRATGSASSWMSSAEREALSSQFCSAGRMFCLGVFVLALATMMAASGGLSNEAD